MRKDPRPLLERYPLDRLLAPPGGGVGIDPRDDPMFLEVKDARVEARLAERDAAASADAEADPLRAGLRAWTQVAEGSGDLIAGGAKDLQLAAWLTEAWLRTDGLPGLAAGFALIAGLVETFWDEGLHPQEDEDGVETRVAPLFGLFGRGETGTLVQPIKLLPLTDRSGDPVALWTVENARAQGTRHDDPDVRDELVARRQERIDAIDEAIARASPEFAARARAAVASALVELDRLMAGLDARTPFGRFGTQVQRPLEEVQALLRSGDVSQEAAAVEAAIPEIVETAVPSPGPAVAPPPSATGAMTRARALATLIDIAAFFDRNEPQSLVGAGLREIVRRADLPVDALLRELLPEEGERRMFLMRAGIRATQPDDDGSY